MADAERIARLTRLVLAVKEARAAYVALLIELKDATAEAQAAN